VSIQNNQPVAVTTTLRIRLNIQLADGTNLNDALNFVTVPFQVLPSGKTITNLNIGHEIMTATPVELSPEAKDRVEDVALATGKFPAGSYLLSFTLEPLVCNGDTKDIKFDLLNPSRVELRSPRDGETVNEFPFFEFYDDAEKSTITVAEKLPDQTNEEALSHQPPMLDADLSGTQHSFQYSGGRPLEEGKTYVWRITGQSTIAGGIDADIQSPIWSFTVSSGGEELSGDAILLQLEEILGPRYKAVFNQIRNGGYKLDSSTLNNSTISRQELMELINSLRDMADSVDLTLE
jgi:hypothetical protein